MLFESNASYQNYNNVYLIITNSLNKYGTYIVEITLWLKMQSAFKDGALKKIYF